MMNFKTLYQVLFRAYLSKKKTPRIIQMEATECGAAALAIVLGYYKKFVSLEELRVLCGVSRDGINAYDMLQGAKQCGLIAEAYETEFEILKEQTEPTILHWGENHFIVLEEWIDGRVYINDPATGPRLITPEELAKNYSGLLIELTPGKNFVPSGKPDYLYDRLKTRFSPFKSFIPYLLGCEVILLFLGFSSPVFSRVFLDHFFSSSHPTWQTEFLTAIGIVALTVGLISYLQGSFLNRLNARFSIYFSTEFLSHVLKLPYFFFTQRFGG